MSRSHMFVESAEAEGAAEKYKMFAREIGDHPSAAKAGLFG